MPGGPVAAGGGIGANAPKNKLTGVVMVRPFHRAYFAPPLMLFPSSQDLFRRIRWYPIWL
jgi:hypothetical protein